MIKLMEEWIKEGKGMLTDSDRPCFGKVNNRLERKIDIEDNVEQMEEKNLVWTYY